MKNWSKIRPHLIENFSSTFSDYLSDKDFSLEQGLDLFEQVCTINEIDEALYNYYEQDSHYILARTILASKIEIFLKKILVLVDENPITGEMASCLKRFFSDSGVTNRTTIDDFFKSDANKNPIKKPADFIGLIPFGYSIKYSYDLRNSITHKISITNKSTSLDIHELVTTYIHFTLFYYDKIKSELLKKAEPIHDFTAYLNSVKSQFAARIGRFVHINGQEDIVLMNSYAVERTDYSERNVERRGTIDELRRNKVPEKRMMLWGDAGTGKSTSLEYLAYIDAEAKLRDDANKIPVYLSLALLTNSNVSITDSIFKKLNIEPVAGEKLLINGKINLFLDGINEIPKDADYKLKTLRSLQISNFLKDYPECFIILSNRPQDIQTFSSVPVFRLLKMDDLQIEDFLFKNVTNLLTRTKIQEEISSNSRLKEIVRVPLMLSRFVDVVTYNGEIPKSRGEIIHHFITGLYTRERTEKKDAAFNTPVINRLLAKLGHESLEKKETNSGLTENEIISIFIQVKRELGVDIDLIYALKIVTELGILEERDGLYLFAHQEYQDYFNVEQERISEGK